MNALRVFTRTMVTERTVNKVTLLGRVGADAQLKGNMEHPVVTFSVATNSGPKPEWHRVSVFKPGLRKLAEDYIKTGSRLYVEGAISYGHIVDRTGNAIPTTNIIADNIIFLNKVDSDQLEDREALNE